MYTIKEVCNLTGLSRKAILYYDSTGLLHPSERSESGYRFYSYEDVEVLRLIKNLRSIEFSVSDIKKLLSPDAEEDAVQSLFNRRRNDLLTQSNDYYVLAKKIDYVEQCFGKSMRLGTDKKDEQPNGAVLLVFNMQNDFIYGTLRSDLVENVTISIKNLVTTAWQTNIPIIHICDCHHPGQQNDWEIWGAHAEDGSEGADIIKMLRGIPYEYLVKKRGYSAFYDTKLDDILAFWGIKHIFMCGVYTEVAIFQSTLDAFNRGYKTWLVEDCLTGHQKIGHENAMNNMKVFCHAKVIQSAAVFPLFHEKNFSDYEQ